MQTLETMAILARAGSREPGTAALVAGIVRNSAGTSDMVSAIDNFLRNTFVYRGERDEVLRTVPYMLHDFETLRRMEGDCDDMTIMGCAMLMCAGISCRMTAIKAENPDEFDHVFSEARVGQNWIPVDPTVPLGTQYRTFGFMSEAVC